MVDVRAHAKHPHECQYCGKIVYGNGYYMHKRACRRKHDDDMAARSGEQESREDEETGYYE